MGCGIAVSKSGGLNVQGVVIEGARACGYCKAPCVSSYGKGICDLCGATVPKAVPVWRCSAGCGFFSCATCELHLSMLGEDVKRLQAAAGLVDPDSASSRHIPFSYITQNRSLPGTLKRYSRRMLHWTHWRRQTRCRR